MTIRLTGRWFLLYGLVALLVVSTTSCDWVGDTKGICPTALGQTGILKRIDYVQLAKQPWVISIETSRIDCNKYSDGTQVGIATRPGGELLLKSWLLNRDWQYNSDLDCFWHQELTNGEGHVGVGGGYFHYQGPECAEAKIANATGVSAPKPG